jgi:nicotinamide riboside transporter PnuC
MKWIARINCILGFISAIFAQDIKGQLGGIGIILFALYIQIDRQNEYLMENNEEGAAEALEIE